MCLFALDILQKHKSIKPLLVDDEEKNEEMGKCVKEMTLQQMLVFVKWSMFVNYMVLDYW